MPGKREKLLVLQVAEASRHRQFDADGASQFTFLRAFPRIAGNVSLALGTSVTTQTRFSIEQRKEHVKTLSFLYQLAQGLLAITRERRIPHLLHRGDLKGIRLVLGIAEQVLGCRLLQ